MEKDPQWCVCEKIISRPAQQRESFGEPGGFCISRKKVQFRDACEEGLASDPDFQPIRERFRPHLFRAHKKLHLSARSIRCLTWGLDENDSLSAPAVVGDIWPQKQLRAHTIV